MHFICFIWEISYPQVWSIQMWFECQRLIFCNTQYWSVLTLFSVSMIDQPILFAVDIEALRVECAVNIVMSIPHMPKESFTYRAIVCELTALCGYAYDKISCCGVSSRFFLKRSVCDLYFLRQLIFKFLIEFKWLKKPVGLCLPGLAVFWIVLM